MLEFVLEIIFTGIIEFLVDLPRRRDGAEQTSDRQPPNSGSRGALWAKIALGVVAGLAWGYYVGAQRDGWPGTFWTFSAFGLATWAMSAAKFSNEEWALTIESDWLRKLAILTPQRLSNMAIFSVATAAAIAVGFFLAG